MLRLVHREGARAKKQRAIRQQRLQSYAVCHMTATPERGPVVLIYGCSECNWIYRPQTPEETSQMSWIAQVNFLSQLRSARLLKQSIGNAALQKVCLASNLICGSPDFHEKRYHWYQCRL